TNFPVGLGPVAVVTADFNGDSKLDLAVANQILNTVSLLLGDGGGGFGPQTAVGGGPVPSALALDDFDKDGKADLAVANQYSKYVSILLNTCALAPPIPTADLQLTNIDSPDPVIVTTPLTYTLTVTNKGPKAAKAVTLSDSLPPGVTLVSASVGCSGT